MQFDGLAAVELASPDLHLVVVVSRGPRIAHLSRNGGQNLLLWEPGRYLRGKWDLLGGHRCWLTRPGADESEETYAEDSEPCAWDWSPQEGLHVRAPLDSRNGVAKSLTIRPDGRGRMMVRHRVQNASDLLWSGGIWGLTCTVPSAHSTYHVPLSDGSAWDTAAVTLFRRWGGSHTGNYDDGQLVFTHDGAVVRPTGRENKWAFRAAPGIVAWHDAASGILFAKKSARSSGAEYPLDANLALYAGADSFMVEMETMSPFVSLKPREDFVHEELWVLATPERGPPTAAQLTDLVAR